MSKRYEEIMRKASMRAEALKIVAGVRDETVELCAKTIESLYLDSQGLILCADTIDACARIVRSLIRPLPLSKEEGHE